MTKEQLLTIGLPATASVKSQEPQKVLLMKPPFFTPWTPPLGIAILKSFLGQRGHSVTCYDHNTDPVLWGTHHKYFDTLQKKESLSMNDGYSKLWWVLNAHFLMYLNGASTAERKELIQRVIRYYSVAHDSSVIETLDPIVVRFFHRLDEIAEELDLTGYSVIGTSTYTTSLSSSLYILRKAKEKNPAIKTVMGGGVFADDLALGSENLETLLREYAFVDHVVLGEGELLFSELLAGTLAGKRVITIADLERSTLPIGEVPPPDFSDFDMSKYYHLSIEGARSCPFQCSFCSETIQWGDYRKKPSGPFTEQVIELTRNYGLNEFFMGDSLMDPYIMGFSRELIERGAQIKYDGYLRADKIAGHRDKARQWARSGLYRVRLGVESASAAVLKAMYKMTTPETISEALKSLSNAGVRTTTYWIVGFPGETEENFQETLDFIQDHHRLIYELEAHPFYYYPYGQVGSRFYQSFSIYPQEVTDVTRFKVWEVQDVQPSRHERYDRLRRVSELASQLGLPNIYTMAERFQAEERWQRLHPQAFEVFEATHPGRSRVMLPEAPLPTRELIGPSGEALVVASQVIVREPLVTELLERAVEAVARGNEMLQLRADGERLIAGSAEPMTGADLLREHSLEAVEPSERAARSQEILEREALEVAPLPGRSLRLVVLREEESCARLCLMLHRQLGDGRSTALLFEDLYRAYEQLAAGRPVHLLPVALTYTELCREKTPPVGVLAAGGFGRRRRIEIDLGADLRRQLRSGGVGEYGLSAEEVIVAAVLRALAAGETAVPGALEVIIDSRAEDSRLERTVGPLSIGRRLSFGSAAADDLPELLAHVRRNLGPSSAADRPPMPIAAESEVLVNLEGFGEPPWLGGDAWLPDGSILVGHALPWRHAVVVEPSASAEGLRAVVSYLEDGSSAELGERLAAALPAACRELIEHCRRFPAAQRFWRAELADDLPALSLGVGDLEDVEQGWGSQRFFVAETTAARLEQSTGCDSGVGLLGAFAVLLSRWTGREELLLLSSMPFAGAAHIVPMRVQPAWQLEISSFVRQLAEKTAAAAHHADFALAALACERRRRGAVLELPVLYSFSKDPEVSHAESPQQRLGEFAEGLALILEVSCVPEGYALLLRYRLDRLGEGTAEDLGSCLLGLLERVAEDPTVKIDDIALTPTGQSPQPMAPIPWQSDAFDF